MPQYNQKHVLKLFRYVLNHWEGEDIAYEQRSGYNIAALIVDAHDQPVWYERNKVNINANVIEHAELQAIQKYLRHSGLHDLKGHTIYASLEPCIMCVGAMIMSNVEQVYFCQHDHNFAHAAERLSIDSSSINGYPPYPRTVRVEPIHSDIVQHLDKAHKAYMQRTGETIMAKFLASEEARREYKIVLYRQKKM